MELPAFLNYTEATAFGMQQGALAGIIFFLGLILIWLLPKYKWTIAAILITCITPLALLGFWYSTGQLGISDWDYYFSLHTTHRNALLTHGELPHWNPYTCGGTAGIADPEFRFFTPTFITQLLFGIPVGFRLSIFLATAVGGLGMLMLSKRIGLHVFGALTAGLILSFSSVNLLEIVEGHPNIFSAMWIPWIFWAWLGAFRHDRNRVKPWYNIWIAITAVFLTLTFFQGGIYLLMYTGLSFLVLPWLTPKPLSAIRVTVIAGLLALGLSAVKLIPVFLWLQQFQDKAYASSTFILPYLHKILFARILHGAEEVIPSQGSGWHEYGAYIGIFAAITACIGLIFGWKQRITKSLLIAFVLTTLIASAGPYLKPIFDQAPFLPRSNISRLMLFSVISLALLAGRGVDVFIKKTKVFQVISLILIGVIAIDLMSLSYALSEQAFVLPRNARSVPTAPHPIGYTAFNYEVRHNGVDYTRAYEAILSGYGSLSYCSVLSPESAVRTIHDEVDNGIFSIKAHGETVGTFSLESWSPNKVVATIQTTEDADVILNTNYAKGWMVNGSPAREIGGRVGTKVPTGTHHIVFEYITPGFALGSVVSILTLVGMLYLIYRSRYMTNRQADSQDRLHE